MRDSRSFPTTCLRHTSAAIVAWFFLASCVAISAELKADELRKDAIIGVWVVEAVDAPFTHHMFVFNADGTMQQANPDGGTAGLSGSDGMGIWVRKGDRILGKFVEIVADRETTKFESRGEITYEIRVSGDRFTGEAVANFYGIDSELLRGPLPTPLKGQRVVLP